MRPLCLLALLLATPATAQTVTRFARASNTTPGVWFKNDVRAGGDARMMDLTGVGGALELTLPSGAGAARITTGFDNADKAEVGVGDDFGLQLDVLSTLQVTYSYFKAANPGQNASGAPSLKLAFFNPNCLVAPFDCFGTLVYEPTWNQPGFEGSSVNVPEDQWLTDTIDFNTGLFWWTGGFGQPNSAGGPPLHTLAQWQALFNSDFDGAVVLLVSVGVGSFNQGQIGYFDDLQISHSFGAGLSRTYDFEGPPAGFTSASAPVGVTPCDVVLAELSGDGSLDIATADSGADSVTVLTNDGTGGFASSTTIALGAGDAPAALAAADLVVGGGTDLVVAAPGNEVVQVVRNDPPGTFSVASTTSTLAVGNAPVSAAAGDLNGVGVDDVALALEGLPLSGGGGVAVILDGGAPVLLTAPVGGYLRPLQVELCDLDGDGDSDLVATMAGTVFSPTLVDNVLLYENDGVGVGGFAAPVMLSVSQNPDAICCGDLDGDGDNDIVVTFESFPSVFPGAVQVLVNDGLTAGAWLSTDFSDGGAFSGGIVPSALACGDLRDDTLPGFCSVEDVVVVNFGSGDLTHLDGYDGSTSLFDLDETLLAGMVPAAVAIGELSGDRTPDIVVANKASDDVTVLLSVTPTLTKAFGVGCPGTGGLIPVISAVGEPSLGNAAFGVRVANARPFSPAFLGFSLTQVTTPFGACTLYLLPPLTLAAAVTDPLGKATVGIPVPPASPGLLGLDVFFQFVVFDPAGMGPGGTAFSNALRTKLGS